MGMLMMLQLSTAKGMTITSQVSMGMMMLTAVAAESDPEDFSLMPLGLLLLGAVLTGALLPLGYLLLTRQAHAAAVPSRRRSDGSRLPTRKSHVI